MTRYHFVTVIDLAAPREQVWELLEAVQTWPSWWRWLKRVDVLEAGDRDGRGARYRYVFGTALPYTLTFELETVRSVRPSFFEAHASGDLAGRGRWELSETDAGTRAQYTWVVETTKRWMNALAPLARPAFSWNHDRLMRDFAHGFARQLGAPEVAVENRTVSPESPQFGRLPEAGPS